MTAWQSQRLSRLPEYLFVEIDGRKREAINAGRDVIDFGVGDPDCATPEFIINAMAEAIRDPAFHSYPPGRGTLEFRQMVADFFSRRFGVSLEEESEILALIGSKEGLGHLPTAVINPGNTVLIPDPGYPVYTGATVLADGRCHVMPLCQENAWLPDFDEIPREVRNAAKLMFLNYPNNPTAATAPLSFFEETVAFAREHGILVAHDAAYSEVFYEHPPPSILQVEGAKEVCVEFHSLSKTFNMTGWRVGFAVGNGGVLASLAKVKNNMDSGVFGAIQKAAVEALGHIHRDEIRRQMHLYRKRRDTLCNGLRNAGWDVAPPSATFYVWAKCPSGTDSMALATKLLDEADCVAIPGIGFGSCGEGYLRFALTVSEQRTLEAVERIASLSW